MVYEEMLCKMLGIPASGARLMVELGKLNTGITNIQHLMNHIGQCRNKAISPAQEQKFDALVNDFTNAVADRAKIFTDACDLMREDYLTKLREIDNSVCND